MRSKCKCMKSAQSKAKTPSVKHSYKKDQTGPSVVEASADSDASPEIVPPVTPAEDSTLASEITKAMLAKVRRAFGKAGKEASEEEQLKFAEELIAAGVPILGRSSSRIAKVLKGEETLEDLKISKSRKPKTA
jgi:ribosome-binding ATPase YchF (GTP1/OBG family)